MLGEPACLGRSQTQRMQRYIAPEIQIIMAKKDTNTSRNKKTTKKKKKNMHTSASSGRKKAPRSSSLGSSSRDFRSKTSLYVRSRDHAV